MLRWLPAAFVIAILCGVAAYSVATHVPDLSPAKAADLISRAPEFNPYSRLIQVQGIFHFTNSMDTASSGTFTFRYLNSPADTAQIKASADFSYWDGTWHLNQFYWGWPDECHTVDVQSDPPKHR